MVTVLFSPNTAALHVAPEATFPANARHDAMLAGQRVPVHQATRRELESLPGVGPVLAGRVLAARRGGACWPNLEALAEVQGIGPHTISGLRTFAYVGCLP